MVGKAGVLVDDAEYQFCARLGMTPAECARHLGVSRAAVTKAKQRLRLTFGSGMALSQGRQWEMECFRYPFDAMDVGDWVESVRHAGSVASRANVIYAPKRFRSITRDGLNLVMRAA